MALLDENDKALEKGDALKVGQTGGNRIPCYDLLEIRTRLRRRSTEKPLLRRFCRSTNPDSQFRGIALSFPMICGPTSPGWYEPGRPLLPNCLRTFSVADAGSDVRKPDAFCRLPESSLSYTVPLSRAQRSCRSSRRLEARFA